MKSPFFDWFREPGAYVLVDGQFGSTGKGLLAGLIAEMCAGRIDHVTTNAGPNSGHTAFFDGEEVMTQQLPVASVFLEKLGHPAITWLNGGSVIDPGILSKEVAKFGVDHLKVMVHPCAAMISAQDIGDDIAGVGRIASTGKGIGPAIARKIMRQGGQSARDMYMPMLPMGYNVDEFGWDRMFDWSKDRVFVETAQGFSLGINSARFYPHTTSRECTVMQAIADARIPAQMVKKVVACFRTFPIRVGNTPTGYSGDGYPDQLELTWEDINRPPELTTVTKRVRRLFQWSRTQFKESIAANRPDIVFLNFCNYLGVGPLGGRLHSIKEDYFRVMGREPDEILLGFGPTSAQVCTLNDYLAGAEAYHG